jgi:hypothetical protein
MNNETRMKVFLLLVKKNARLGNNRALKQVYIKAKS